MKLDQENITTAKEMAKVLRRSGNGELTVVGMLLDALLKEREEALAQSQSDVKQEQRSDSEHTGEPVGEPYGYLKLNTGKFVNDVEGLNPMKDKRYLPLYTKAQPKQEQGEPVEIHQYSFKELGKKAPWYDGNQDQTKWPRHVYNHRIVYTTPQQRKPLTDEQKIVLGFLDGSNPLQGVWYGEDHPAFGQAKHWWRRFLCQAFADDFSAHGIAPQAKPAVPKNNCRHCGGARKRICAGSFKAAPKERHQ